MNRIIIKTISFICEKIIFHIDAFKKEKEVIYEQIF